MKLLNKIWKEYEDERNSRKYFSEKRKERLQNNTEQKKKSITEYRNNFGKKLEYKGSTYNYGKPKYQTSLGLVK